MANKELPTWIFSGLGDLASVLNLLYIASTPEEFEEWIRNNTNDDIEDITVGYVFFFECIIHFFTEIAPDSKAVDLETHYVVKRAEGELIDPDKIPESNERLNFYRNLKQIQSNIRSVQYWDSIDQAIEELDILLQCTEKTIESIKPTKDSGLSKEEALNTSSRIRLIEHFVATDKHAPRAYGPSNLQKWLYSGKRGEQALKGYTRTLQFVFSELLSEEEYEESVVQDIHTASTWQNDYFDDNREIELHQFYPPLRNQLLKPIDEEFNAISSGTNVYPDDLLESSTDNSKDIFRPLLQWDEVPDRSDLTKEEELDYILFWNDAEWLGNATFSKDPTFETTLRGLAMSILAEEGNVPIHVARIKHPTDGGDNRYSYGILQRLAYTGLGDPSGWIIFYQVGTDFSGSQSRVNRIEDTIESISEIWPVECRDITIEMDYFRELMAERLVDDYLQLELEAESALDRLDSTRGYLVELLGYYALSQKHGDSHIEWSEDPGSGEVDLMVRTNDVHRLIECKLNPKSIRIDEEVEKLSKKARALDGNDLIEIEFLFWFDPDERQIEHLSDEGISYTVLKNHTSLQNIDLTEIDTIFSRTLREERLSNELDSRIQRFPDVFIDEE